MPALTAELELSTAQAADIEGEAILQDSEFICAGAEAESRKRAENFSESGADRLEGLDQRARRRAAHYSDGYRRSDERQTHRR